MWWHPFFCSSSFSERGESKKRKKAARSSFMEQDVRAYKLLSAVGSAWHLPRPLRDRHCVVSANVVKSTKVTFLCANKKDWVSCFIFWIAKYGQSSLSTIAHVLVAQSHRSHRVAKHSTAQHSTSTYQAIAVLCRSRQVPLTHALLPMPIASTTSQGCVSECNKCDRTQKKHAVSPVVII